MLTEKKRRLTEIFFYQKQYVLYGLNLTSELVYRFLRRVDRKRKLLIDRKTVPFYSYKTYTFIKIIFSIRSILHSVNPPFGQLEVYIFGQD